ncbi:MAG: hypothetical protein IKE70_00735 [Bacilli bacterium]|nr:hypothetical protein [Bacilli bacterium]
MNLMLRQMKIMEYLKSHPNLLTEKEKEYFLSYKGNLEEDIRRYPDYFRQIFDELGFIDEDNNLYCGFINLLEEEFQIENKNIVEVGAGRIPRLGKRITSKQVNGTITIYDPLLYETTSTQKFHLKKEKFNRNTSLKNVDLLIGLMPCEAADIMVERALEEDIDFMIALCEGGPHGDIFDYYESDEEWRDSLVVYANNRLAEKKRNPLGIKHLTKYKNPYPVIYTKK